MLHYLCSVFERQEALCCSCVLAYSCIDSTFLIGGGAGGNFTILGLGWSLRLRAHGKGDFGEDVVSLALGSNTSAAVGVEKRLLSHS